MAFILDANGLLVALFMLLVYFSFFCSYSVHCEVFFAISSFPHLTILQNYLYGHFIETHRYHQNHQWYLWKFNIVVDIPFFWWYSFVILAHWRGTQAAYLIKKNIVVSWTFVGIVQCNNLHNKFMIKMSYLFTCLGRNSCHILNLCAQYKMMNTCFIYNSWQHIEEDSSPMVRANNQIFWGLDLCQLVIRTETYIKKQSEKNQSDFIVLLPSLDPL